MRIHRFLPWILVFLDDSVSCFLPSWHGEHQLKAGFQYARRVGLRILRESFVCGISMARFC
jgi:hypothetical protein